LRTLLRDRDRLPPGGTAMNRRDFSTALGAFGALASAPVLVHAAAADSTVGPAARALYSRALILDCNCSPPYDELPLPPSALDLVRNSGISVVKTSIGGINADFAGAVGEIAQLMQLIELYPAYFTQVRVAADMARAKRENKLGIIFSFESAEMLNGKLTSLTVFRDLGVRVMQLSYNRKSPFAAGVMEPDGGGLTPLGRDAVREMNRLGIAVDLSHANPATTSDVLNLAGKPPVMTHAGCAALHAHPRLKTDDQLRALVARGGVVGIFDLPYLTASPHQPTVDDYVAHLVHALKIAGEDHVGIGSDAGIAPFDTSPAGMAEFAKDIETRRKQGLSAPEEDRPPFVVGLNTPRRIEIIADQLLKHGYSAVVTEKIVGGNFARVFTEIWG